MTTTKECKDSLIKHEAQKLNEELETVLMDYGYGTLNRSEAIAELSKKIIESLERLNRMKELLCKQVAREKRVQRSTVGFYEARPMQDT